MGTVVCKMGQHRNTFRGYIAMLVVIKPYRGRGIGNFLIRGIDDFQFDLMTLINLQLI